MCLNSLRLLIRVAPFKSCDWEGQKWAQETFGHT